MTSPTPLTIWTNQHFDDADLARLRAEASPHRVVVSAATSKSNLVAGGRDPAALEADILYGQPHVQDVLESTRVKWVQLTTAGYTRFDRPEIFDALRAKLIAFCNASALYDEPCAQHVVAMLLAMARAIPQAALDQPHARWNYLPLRGQSFLLGGQKVLIVGYGAIARRVVELLAPYRLDITAFRRSVRGDENCPTLPIDQFGAHASAGDIVINILPSSPSTANFFNADRLAKLMPGAIYINIGRGDTNDQDALASLLQSGHLSKAFLDVTNPEPLPKDHPLWTTPNCHITPHTAGGTFDEPNRMLQHFLTNLKRYEQGETLIDRIA
jgi:phosphoglycerate dehydrogenase-like enzyme